MGLFATKETIVAAKQASRLRGVLDGQELARAFAWLRPNDLIWSYWVNNYLIGNDPAAFDVLYWNNDTTRLPARLHADMLDVAGGLAERRSDMDRPFPAGLIGRPADGHSAKRDEFEFSELELAHFIGLFEAFQDDVGVHPLLLQATAAVSTDSPPAGAGCSNAFELTEPSSQLRHCGGDSKAICRL